MRIRIERERERKKNKETEGNEAKKWWKSEMENKNYTFVVQNGKHIYIQTGQWKRLFFFYFYYYFHGCSGCWLKIPKPIILLVLFIVVVRHHRLLPYIFFSFNLVFFSFHFVSIASTSKFLFAPIHSNFFCFYFWFNFLLLFVWNK